VFTSGIVSVDQAGRSRFTSLQPACRREHRRGAEKAERGAAEARSRCAMRLSRNVPKLPAGVEILLANCLAHGRRQFGGRGGELPQECRFVLEMLGQVYGHDAEARERGLTPDERCAFIRNAAGR